MWKQGKKTEKEEKNVIQKEKEEKIKKGENEDDKEDIKSINQKSTKKPFILKIHRVSIKKKIIEFPKPQIIKKGSKDLDEKLIFLRDKIIKINRILLINHFFNKWKGEITTGNNIVLGINILQNIVRRYIIRYLIMHIKILKFKTFLIKYALHRNKHTASK